MARRNLVVLGLAVLVITGAAASVLFVLMSFGHDGATSVETTETTPTADASNDGADADDAADDSTPTPTPHPPFSLSVDQVETCGDTCRDVSSTLTNEQSTDATNVTVETQMYAGNGTDGDVVWEGTETVGALDAGESYTSTNRVELSFSDAIAVDRTGSWITIETTVTSEETTTTIIQRRDVG